MGRIFLVFVFAILIGPAWAAGTSGEEGAQFPTDDPAHARAVEAIKAENFGRAVKLLRDVVDRNPDNIDALSNLGYANARLGRHDRAKRRYARALALEPGHLGANEYLGELYLRQGKLAAAITQLAVLRGICGAGCPEAGDLAAAIASYRKTGRFQDDTPGNGKTER